MRRSQSTSFLAYMLRSLPLFMVVLVAFSSIQTHAAPVTSDLVYRSQELDTSTPYEQLGDALLARSPEPLEDTKKKPVTTKPKKTTPKKTTPKKTIPKKVPPKKTTGGSCPFTPGGKGGKGGKTKLSKRCNDPFGLPLTTAELTAKFQAVSKPGNLVFYTGSVPASGRIAWIKANSGKMTLRELWKDSKVDESAWMKVTPPAGKDAAALEKEWFNRASEAMAKAAEGATEIKLLVPKGYDATRGASTYWARVEFPTIKKLASKPKVVTVAIDNKGVEDTAESKQLWP